MRFIMLLILAFGLFGCKSIDVSGEEPYRALIGSQVTLQRDVILKDVAQDDVLCMSSMASSNDLRADLSAGTPVQISQVVSYPYLTPHLMVYGTGVHPITNASFKWSYQWGMGNELRRAPWEDPKQVPELRMLQDKGRVVTAWDGSQQSQFSQYP